MEIKRCSKNVQFQLQNGVFIHLSVSLVSEGYLVVLQYLLDELLEIAGPGAGDAQEDDRLALIVVALTAAGQVVGDLEIKCARLLTVFSLNGKQIFACKARKTTAKPAKKRRNREEQAPGFT